MYDSPVFRPAGDQALVVELGDSIEPETNRRVRNLLLAIEKAEVPGVFDLVPTYRSLLVYYDPTAVSAEQVQSDLEGLESDLDEMTLESPQVVQLPTMYGGEYGPDLEFVAEHAGLSTEDVVSIHSGTDYLVYMMGFSPGFPYLGGLSDQLVTPRLDTPRGKIPAGSVGIADSQTGVYPVASPGGWRLIGRTPLDLFSPDRDPPALLSAGNYVRFVPVATEDEYVDIRHRVETGDYEAATEAAS